LATLAHELRNPLAPLRMGLDLLRRNAAVDPNRTLSVMQRQLDHVVRLIDDLLDVARISGGKLDLKKERVQLAICVDTALETTRPFFEKRRQRVSVENDRRIFGVVDPVRVTQIIANLLHNAAKFTPEGGLVEVELSFANAAANVRVTDHGLGIEPEQREHIFEMFARVERAGMSAHSGLGIGLALARKLAELHDGRLRVESAGLGHGSTFTLSLPAELGEEVAATPSQPPPPRARNPTKVVIIEDNQDAAEVLALSLQTQGYSTAVAHSGPAGLLLVEQTRPDVVLCDLGLPGMDGIEVCRRVRQLAPEAQPVMVALTGWGMQKDRERTQATGFDHHLVKPVAPAALFELLDSLALTE